MSIKKNIAYSVVLNTLNVLFPVLTVPYVSRVLGVANIGVVNFVITYISYFVLFATLGIGYYGVREIAKYKFDVRRRSEIFSEIFFINIASTILSVIPFFISLFIFPMLAENKMMFLIAGFSLYLAPLSIDWYFQGLEDYKIITVRSFIVKLLSVASLYLFVTDRSDLVPYLLINIVSTVFANLWNMIYALRNKLNISFKNLKFLIHIRPILVLFISILAISIFTMLDTLMLGFMSNYKEVGIYTSATKITRVILPVFTAIASVLLPRISFNHQNKNKDTNDELIQKSFDLMIFLAIPGMLGLFLSAPRFVPLFLGKGFLEATIPLQILSILTLIVSLNIFWGVQILIGLGLEKAFLKSVACAALINFVFNLIFIPRYGSVGTSCASVIGEGVQLVMNLYFIYKLTDIRVKWKAMADALLYSLPLILVYFLLNGTINDDFLFLVSFCTVGAILYLLLQFWGRNVFLSAGITYIRNKIRI